MVSYLCDRDSGIGIGIGVTLQSFATKFLLCDGQDYPLPSYDMKAVTKNKA